MVPWRAWCDTFGQFWFQDFNIYDLCAHLEEVLGCQGVRELPEPPEKISAVPVFIVSSAEAGKGGHDNG